MVILFHDLAGEVVEQLLVVAQFLDVEVGADFTAPVGEIGLERFALGDDVGDGGERKGH